MKSVEELTAEYVSEQLRRAWFEVHIMSWIQRNITQRKRFKYLWERIHRLQNEGR
jgi:hypothetical protein